MSDHNYVGVILAGGGGKGAYQAGVWVSLQEIIQRCNLKPVAFSGASVGALNAALFACNSPEECENVWRKITPQKVLRFDDHTLQNIYDDRLLIAILSAVTITTPIIAALITGLYISTPIMPLLLPWPLIFRYISKSALRNDGIFSQDGIKKLIIENIPENKLLSSYIYASITADDKMKQCYYQRLKTDTFINTLLASSALPLVFGSHTIPIKLNQSDIIVSGLSPKKMRDGGLTDNLPVYPLLQLRQNGLRFESASDELNTFIVIHLDDSEKWENCDLSGCKFYHIFPSQKLHGLWGTLDFSEKTIISTMDLGKNDIREELTRIDQLQNFFNTEYEGEKHYYRGNLYDSLKEVYKVANKYRSSKK